MSKKTIISTAFLLFIQLLSSQIIINEVMFDAAGSEYHDEFVEIYNNSDAIVDLSGWMISDDDEADLLIKFNGFDNMLLNPHCYCVVMDSSYYLNSTYYETLIPDSTLRVMINDGSFGSSGLNNTDEETVTIYDPDSTIVSFYMYLNDQEAGFSDERVNFDEDIWGNSKILDGTPGFKNSVSPYDNDLELTLVNIPDDLQINTDFRIDLKVKNIGINSIDSFRCNAYSAENLLNFHDHGLSILPLDSVEFPITLNLSDPGTNAVRFELETSIDDYLLNNEVDTTIYIPYNERSLVLNEFMKYPNDSQCEWIEVVNVSEDSLSLSDFLITDSNKDILIPFPNISLLPNDLFVIAESDLIYNFPAVDPVKVHIDGSLPGLNNDTDCIYILDKKFSTVDSIIYMDFDDDNGISIEKINPKFNSSMLSNWVYSVSTATPTMKNSVYQDPSDINNLNDFSLYPKTVTPNDDGNNDNLIISYDFDSAYIYLTVKIYNIKGQQ
ncbi:MAG: lamin tail domain-containing protein, partial [Candidatus Delongbacteria bacterium]|nr:lamin tail domain-containing protein [Candidatus Delongbacteria bacterium]